jgi:hypothetical protein
MKAPDKTLSTVADLITYLQAQDKTAQVQVLSANKDYIGSYRVSWVPLTLEAIYIHTPKHIAGHAPQRICYIGEEN